MANSPRLAELADLITRREYNYAMCKARKHTEDLVRRYALDHDVEYTTLADTIEALYEAGVIGDVSRENLHGIRILGNKAVHQDDNDAQDAKSAYEMLKKELGTYSDQKYTNPERTPVAISRDTTAEEYGARRRHRETQANDGDEGEIDVSYASSGRRRTSSSRTSSGNSGKKKSSGGESTLYTVLKILIPVLIIVLLVVLLLSMFGGGGETEETTTAAVEETTVEETTEEETTTEAPTTEAPTTEAPTTEASVSYEISGEGVRIRLASDPDTVYTNLSTGTFIGPVTDFENNTGNSNYDNFARFAYDGKDVIVSKKYIRKTTEQ